MSGIVFAVALSFYTNLLARGQADAVAHNDAKAAEELRVASIGLLDDLPRYETAQMYLAVVSNRLGRKDDARIAASRVAHAERLQPGAGAAIDPAIRAEFEHLESGPPARSRRDSVPATQAARPEAQPPRAGGPLSKPDDLMERALAARQLLAEGDSISAQNLAEGVIARDINNGPAQAVLGTIAARAGEWSDAAEHFAIARTSIRLTLEETILYAEALRRSGRTSDARQVYVSLAAIPTLRRDALLRVAQGLNLTFAWRESSAAYRRAFPLLKGEETHMFTEAVNRYELGDVAMARELLQRALPAIPETREVILYRGKILGSR